MRDRVRIRFVGRLTRSMRPGQVRCQKSRNVGSLTVPTHPTLSAVQLRASTGGSYGGTTQLSSAQSHDSLMFASQLSHGQHLTEALSGRAGGRYSDLEIVGSPYSLRLLRV